MKTFTPEEIDPSLPEVVKNFLASGKSLEEIKLDANGKWTHEGMDFENPRIVALFSRSVARTSGGTWVLDIPPFTYPIEIEDAPFFVEDITLDTTTDAPTILLSDETEEELDLETLRYEAGGRLYCIIKGGAFKARFKKRAYYKLLDQATLRPDDTIILQLGSRTIELAGLDLEA